MDLLWMILVFLVCARAQNITEVRVELGQNVTLKCSGDNSNTYWYMEMYHSQVQGFIGRSFSNDPSDSQYQVRTVRPKYSAFGNSLMIINITADDCRLYFCGRKINNSVHFMDTFNLVSAMTPSTNDSGLNGASVWQTDLIRTVSLGLNAFLTFGTVSLLCLLLRLKKKKNVSCTDGLTLYENTQSLRTAKVN
ncbi:hypothetical protein Q5P01_005967 [Channa striata]|uniref:Immunoglobulin domain-containing protein n=1 Tax=Channa striata TaxID=64152 RepID=A0AA88T7U4_CHASR|nr:hypothetical protein Q5P01_005967 [Channa striata]